VLFPVDFGDGTTLSTPLASEIQTLPGVDAAGVSVDPLRSITGSITIPAGDGKWSVSSAWTVSIFSGQDVIFEKDNAGAVTRYVTANGMRIAKIALSGLIQPRFRDRPKSTWINLSVSGDRRTTDCHQINKTRRG